MPIESELRQIVRDELASFGVMSAAPDPELISVKETVRHLNAAGSKVATDAIVYSLHHHRRENGFPSVQLGPRTIVVDRRRLNAWIADGGIDGTDQETSGR